jgi:hypothetical protein
MAENTQNGPSGSNKAAMPAVKPVNHNPDKKDGRSGSGSLTGNGVGADASSATLKKVGPLTLDGR